MSAPTLGNIDALVHGYAVPVPDPNEQVPPDRIVKFGGEGPDRPSNNPAVYDEISNAHVHLITVTSQGTKRCTYNSQPSRLVTYLLLEQGVFFALYNSDGFVRWIDDFEEIRAKVHKKMTEKRRKNLRASANAASANALGGGAANNDSGNNHHPFGGGMYVPVVVPYYYGYYGHYGPHSHGQHPEAGQNGGGARAPGGAP